MDPFFYHYGQYWCSLLCWCAVENIFTKNISRVKLFCKSISSGSIVDGVVVDELQDLLDVVVDNVIGKWEEDSPFNLLQVNFRAELFEKVLVFVETDGEEVKKVANIHIVRQAENRI